MAWYDEPLPTHAPPGGFTDPLNGQHYAGGEWTPFYVPRPLMPQVDAADYMELLGFLADRAVRVTSRLASPEELTAHQRISLARAECIPVAVQHLAVLTSREGYVLDGNHRWLWHRRSHSPLHMLQLDAPFEAAIGHLFAFPRTTSGAPV